MDEEFRIIMRTLRRPMFRRGGSAGEGITSGLQRKGFATGSTKDRLMKAIGPSRSSLNDFLINFGLNMVSGAPTGNILQTAATAAKEPYGQFSKDSRAEQDLMRKISLEAETLDIGQEQALALQKLKNQSSTNASAYLKRAREAFELKAINPSTGKPYESVEEAFSILSLGTGDESRSSLTDRISSTRDKYLMAGDEYPVADAKAKYYEDILIRLRNPESGIATEMIGGILPTVSALREKLLKKESSIGKYFYDITDRKVKKFMGIKEVEGQKGYDFVEVDQTTFEEIIPTNEELIDKEQIIGTTESGTKLTRAEAEAEAEARNMVLVPPFTKRGEGAKFRRENPDAISIIELQELIEKEKMSDLYAGVKQGDKVR